MTIDCEKEILLRHIILVKIFDFTENRVSKSAA